MNYYPRYPAHYVAKTLHLSMEQDGAYTRLLDWCYINERAIPHESRYAIARAMSLSERRATDAVLAEFFYEEGTGWAHERAQKEIAAAQPKIAAARENGKKGGNPRKKAGYNEPGTVYAVQRVSGGPIKVGITKYLTQRLSALRKKVGAINLIASAEVMDMGRVEAHIHQAFRGALDGEWITAEWDEILPTWQESTQPGGLVSTQPTTQTPQSPIPNKEQTHSAQPPASRFAEFWAIYPRKRGKKPAQAKWQAKRLDRIADQLIADVRKRIASDDRWKRGFIPDPATYLGQERWEDALTDAAASAPPAMGPRPPSETPFERAVNRARHDHHLGLIDAAERDKRIAEATSKHRSEARA